MRVWSIRKMIVWPQQIRTVAIFDLFINHHTKNIKQEKTKNELNVTRNHSLDADDDIKRQLHMHQLISKRIYISPRMSKRRCCSGWSIYSNTRRKINWKNGRIDANLIGSKGVRVSWTWIYNLFNQGLEN